MTTRHARCNRCGADIDYEVPDVEASEPDRSDWARAIAALRPGICADCLRADSEREAQESAAAAERERIREREARNIPRRYIAATFDSFKPATTSQAKALEAVRSHCEDGVLLVGQSGCGKTHLACAAVSAGPVGGLFVGATELLDDVRRGFDGGGRGLYERALTTPLLVLDDIGQEAVTDWVRDRLYTLVNHRWNEMLPVLVTTNHGPDALAARIGAGTASRIVGLCKRRIQVKGPDGRRTR
jgi:DNA replication protein DnaC